MPAASSSPASSRRRLRRIVVDEKTRRRVVVDEAAELELEDEEIGDFGGREWGYASKLEEMGICKQIGGKIDGIWFSGTRVHTRFAPKSSSESPLRGGGVASGMD
ncbi:hypothetical protein QYE76_006389 [Lolium multiflorum]|uniref:Uncharacterized protein n=1 Tax=Lolium multiflorum TaxID=4521 RepID=A0AAD8W387_LOLMU|nr:hypothetical protein QYE76_006389 [Lolium multiflorum]